MARKITPLNDTQIRKAKPEDSPLRDGNGLLLVITSNSKLWRFRYERPFTKKRNDLSIGAYPDISLAQAREIREEYRALLAQNIDPQTHRQQQEQAKANEISNTYENVAWAWLEHRKTKKNFSDNYQKDVIALIKNNLLPHFGRMPITQITAQWQSRHSSNTKTRAN